MGDQIQLAFSTIRLVTVRNGVRSVPLMNHRGRPYTLATLLVDICVMSKQELSDRIDLCKSDLKVSVGDARVKRIYCNCRLLGQRIRR